MVHVSYNEFLFVNFNWISFRYAIVSQECEFMVVAPENLKRKVMLSVTGNFYIVIDFDRPTMSILSNDVTVPFYPEQGDMVEISGEDSIWYVTIVSVDHRGKTCRVKYYERTEGNAFTPMKENIDTVPWDVMLGLAE